MREADGRPSGRRSRARASASQRSLVAVNEATGTDADRVGPRLPAGRLVAVAELADEVGGRAGGPDVVPEQRVADDGAVLVEADHAVLLAADRQRGDVVQPAGGRGGRLAKRRRQARGSTSVPSGCGARPGADQRAGVGVADDDLAGLGGGVDPGDEGHRGRADDRRGEGRVMTADLTRCVRHRLCDLDRGSARK